MNDAASTPVAFPFVSIIIVSLNCERTIRECLSRIAKQDYPREKVEIFLVDGGSTDHTKDIAREFGVRVIDGGYRDNQEARRQVGFACASGEILAYIDSDNFLPDDSWMKKMVAPLIDDPEIVATQTLRYGHDIKMSVLNRYFALFGVNDPVVFYLGKADRISWYQDERSLPGEIIEDRPGYFKIRFTAESLPTIGCNGFLIRKSALSRLRCGPEEYFHIDVNRDLISLGFDQYGIVKNDVIHATSDTFLKSIMKRLVYMRKHHRQLGCARRYKVFDAGSRKDVFRLFTFIVYSLTVVKPLFDSLRGYFKRRDPAWFLHPFVCLGFTLGYGFSFLRGLVKD